MHSFDQYLYILTTEAGRQSFSRGGSLVEAGKLSKQKRHVHVPRTVRTEKTRLVARWDVLTLQTPGLGKSTLKSR